MPGLRSMIRSIASGVVSMMNSEPDRLVDLDHLPGQPGAQVAGGPVHHAQERGDVVRQLRPAAPAGVVDVREVVFEVDAGADREDRLRGCGSGSRRSASSWVGSYEVRKARRSRNRPRVRSRRPTMQIALVAWPHSGRTCARSSARASTCCRAAGERERQRGRLEPPAPLVGVAVAGRPRSPAARPRTPPGATRARGRGRRRRPSRCSCCACRRRSPSPPGRRARAPPAARGPAGR